MARYLLEASDDAMTLWKADAARRGVPFAVWIRRCLMTGAGRTLPPDHTMTVNGMRAKKTASPPHPADPRPPEIRQQRLTPLDDADPETLQSGSFVRMREEARDLAQREGRCTADVERGVRCRLCGKIH